MELPTQKRKAIEDNPQFLIVFGKPKSGKTTVVSELEDALIIDFEKGSRYVDCMSVEVDDYLKLRELFGALATAKKENPEKEYLYTYGVLDTATSLEELVLPIALADYKATPMGSSFKGTDVRTLPQGGGYLYIRNAYKRIIDAFRPYFKYLILLGHTKDKTINEKGKELSKNTIDLAGKLERIISAEADAIGYIYRKKNQTLLNFNGGGDFIVEARNPHLRGQEFILAESDNEGNLTVDWSKIYV